MAKRQPLRFFFGKFYPGTSNYALIETPQYDDQAYSSFITGKLVDVTPMLVLHTRYPFGTAGFIHNWDEYIDLTTPAMDTDKANALMTFKDIAGVEYTTLWESEPDFLNLPTNATTIEPWIQELLAPTRRLSLPYPDTGTNVAVAPRFCLLAGGYTPADLDGRLRLYMQFRKHDTTILGNISARVEVHYTTGGTSHVLRAYNDNAYEVDLAIFKAPMAENAITGSWEITDFPQAVTGYYFATQIGANTSADITLDLDGLAVTGDYIKFPALNDAIARFRFDCERRHKLDRMGTFKHEVLILNAATHHYYKGFVAALSSVFFEGVPRQPENSAQIVIQITEEGLFSEEAWTNPNGLITVLESGDTENPLGYYTVTDSEATFVTNGVQAGDLVYNITQQFYVQVTAVIGETELAVTASNPPALWAVNDLYEVQRVTTAYLHPAIRKVVNE